jgi:FtsP/CotA-like multicopper oxidase with cupredoxin domain
MEWRKSLHPLLLPRFSSGNRQQGTPWSDGVPGLTQKPIEPGESYVYRFIASPSGTYWYHSHTRATLLDGLYGAMYIR